MRHNMYIPEAVRIDIAERLTEAINATVEEFESAWEDEDVVTGHLGGQMTTRRRKVMVDNVELGGVWTWSLHYRKFGGRGKGAPEKAIGADGIFELSLEHQSYTDVKSLLFQSKVEGGSSGSLIDQSARLSTWREAAFIMVYGKAGFKAVTIDSAMKSKGSVDTAPSTPLEVFLNEEFVACNVGDNDLQYLAPDRQLSWRNFHGEIVAVNFCLTHRFRINVVPPIGGRRKPRIDRHIQPDEIHRHRMDIRIEDLLKVQTNAPSTTPKMTLRALTKIYHPDLFHSCSLETRELMKVRLQEFNEAFDQLRVREQAYSHKRSRSNTQRSEAETPPSGEAQDPSYPKAMK
ncbi:hypothetical protein [Magnetospirillum sp. ME-1]|uniref:hypothetical protein n=1 Tax=Magnetospirillum sp. ME-1 TaxID=1639348 RepID=UPI0011AE32A5|nr:hypothetical protein [Magnetospirillum sp. ME-1]